MQRSFITLLTQLDLAARWHWDIQRPDRPLYPTPRPTCNTRESICFSAWINSHFDTAEKTKSRSARAADLHRGSWQFYMALMALCGVNGCQLWTRGTLQTIGYYKLSLKDTFCSSLSQPFSSVRYGHLSIGDLQKRLASYLGMQVKWRSASKMTQSQEDDRERTILVDINRCVKVYTVKTWNFKPSKLS